MFPFLPHSRPVELFHVAELRVSVLLIAQLRGKKKNLVARRGEIQPSLIGH